MVDFFLFCFLSKSRGTCVVATLHRESAIALLHFEGRRLGLLKSCSFFAKVEKRTVGFITASNFGGSSVAATSFKFDQRGQLAVIRFLFVCFFWIDLQ